MVGCASPEAWLKTSSRGLLVNTLFLHEALDLEETTFTATETESTSQIQGARSLL